MGTKSRITALKFLEMQKKHPEFAKQIGVDVKVLKKEKEEIFGSQYNISRSVFND